MTDRIKVNAALRRAHAAAMAKGDTDQITKLERYMGHLEGAEEYLETEARAGTASGLGWRELNHAVRRLDSLRDLALEAVRDAGKEGEK